MSDTHSIEVGPKGRIVIPVAIRRELGIDDGSELVALVEGGGVLLLPRAEVKRRLRAMFRGAKGMASELIADRRSEARREDRR